MSSAGSSKSYNNNAQTRVAIHCLQELLEILHPDPTPDIFTLNSLQYRYKLHENISLAAIRDIEQAQRINRALGDYRQSGLNEFHIGLIYLYWGECYAAEKQFEMAWRHWSMDHGQVADMSLSLLGRGFAQGLADHEEAAMVSFGKAGRYLERLPQPTSVQMNFYAKMRPCLREAQEWFSEKMRQRPSAEVEPGQTEATTEAESPSAPPEETATVLEPPVDSGENYEPPPPRTNLSDDPLPIDGHVKLDGRYRWYLVERRQTDGFIPQIHSQDWLLVFMQPDQSDLAHTEEQPIVIVCQSDSGSTIHLRPHPSEQVRQGYRIYLRESRGESWSFMRNQETGEVFLTPEGREDVVNLEKIIGIVVGLWRPAKQMVDDR
ncbi:MAG TPA: hypothetical protein PLD25_19955 [Chloroflexota bacterium]|nr:hypothetical protein [Chloroflexota bacterium]HUM68553.1 hypothetical protein [Chloroflexota bacterium]